MKIHVPPIKSQGIKTKLVPWIKNIIPKKFNDGVWIEPFLGTGVVAFNVAPKNALLCDTNPHLINFYTAISNNEITPDIIRDFLNKEGAILLEKGEVHYYAIRERFNKFHSPLDFLFLNRSGFNGMIRFNRKGGLNIPFCKKPARFAKAYVTKIVNQLSYIQLLLSQNNYSFKCQDFKDTIKQAGNNDIIYCDPPYIDRYNDYYNGWNEDNELELFKKLSKSESKFILSTWHSNKYRKNEFIETLWNDYNIITREHFYHIGGSEKNRNKMIEALILNYKPVILKNNKECIDSVESQIHMF